MIRDFPIICADTDNPFCINLQYN